MTSPRPGTRRARLASLLLAALCLTAPLAVLPADPAAAADPSAQVTLTAADVTATTLTLRGTLTNTGPDPLGQVSVALWRSPDLLHSPEAVTTALAAPTTTPGTARVVEDANRSLLTATTDTVAPGESRPFTVSGSLAALGLTAPDATWWAGVDATGRVANRRSGPIGSARTLVTRPDTPRPIATVVEFSAPPRQLKKDLFLDDALRAEVTDGRLARLMSATEATGADWVVDPSLLAELEDMADGYRVQTADGSQAGTGDAAAGAWLARLRALPADRGATGLFGSPDVAALGALGDETIADAIRTASDAATPEGVGRVTVLDHVDAASLEIATGFGRAVVALGATAPQVTATLGGTTVVSAAPPAPTLASPLLPDTPLNRAAARFALARARGGEVRWVRSPDDVAATTQALPYGFRQAALADVLALPPGAWPPSPPQTPTSVALDAERVHRVDDLRDRMSAYGAAAPASGVAEYVDAQTARAASRWWVDDEAGQDAWLSAIERRVALPAGDMVSLDATARLSMAGATSEFPVTVTNHLQDPITVRVVAETDNPQRIRLRGADPVAIPAGASSTVLLLAESAGGGVVRARVHVQTPDGHRLTPDREIAVETTNYGTIGWVLVVASGLVLVVTTAHRIRQVRGQRKGEDG